MCSFNQVENNPVLTWNNTEKQYVKKLLIDSYYVILASSSCLTIYSMANQISLPDLNLTLWH
jgi:hypothetical protein